MSKTNISHTKPTGAKLSDLALVLLSQAANRDDGMLLPAPDSATPRGAALQRVLTKLLKQGLVAETAVNLPEQAWRTEENGHSIGLRITDAGLTAIGVPAPANSDEADESQPANGSTAVQSVSPAGLSGRPRDGAASVRSTAVRPGSKQALLVKELSRAAGATILHLVGMLGWQPHTVRAALTGLRQRGYAVAREKNRKGETVYRATPRAQTRTEDAAS